MYIEGLATNTNFFKKLKILYDRTQNKNKNHHYLEILLETMEYFLNK
jgi:IS4 transposase